MLGFPYTISPQKLKQILNDGEEIALIDVREEGVFGKGHLLLACCIPSSHLELRVADLLPKKSVRIVLAAEEPSEKPLLAMKAAERLCGFGYNDVSILEGGSSRLRAEGFELFSGVNVLSKAFGEFVELNYNTPHLTAQELKTGMEQADNLIILDARPKEEYRLMNIPKGINVPGAELVYRIHDLVPDPKTMIVVNCAGRTRSILGAQSLINAGIPNRVAALQNGTMGWQLAGLKLEHVQNRFGPAPTQKGIEKARICAESVADRFGIQKVDHDTLKNWRSELESRTLYILDVRLPEEFEGGHLEGSRNAPGGQLIQATDRYIVVRNARVLLLDDTEVQATMTASWLKQMGWRDVYVLEGGIGNGPLIKGPHKPEVLGLESVEAMHVSELGKIFESKRKVVIVDFATNLEYKNGHIPGAWWCVRSRIKAFLSKIPTAEYIVLTSPDGIIAQLSYKDVKVLCPNVQVRVLDGGTRAWIETGFPTTEGMENVTSSADDLWYEPVDQEDALAKAMRDYLTWELGLIEQVKRDGNANFQFY